MTAGELQRPGSVVRCGTYSGYASHKRHDEKPCDACVAAKQRYDARRVGAGEQQIRNRLGARAQGRAQVRLKEAHPDEYARLYATAKAEVFAEYERGLA